MSIVQSWMLGWVCYLNSNKKNPRFSTAAARSLSLGKPFHTQETSFLLAASLLCGLKILSTRKGPRSALCSQGENRYKPSTLEAEVRVASGPLSTWCLEGAADFAALLDFSPSSEDGSD